MSRHTKRSSAPYRESHPDQGGYRKKEKRLMGKTFSVVIIFLLAFAGFTVAYKTDLPSVVLSWFGRVGKQDCQIYGDIKAVFDQVRTLSAEEIKGREPIYAIETDQYVSPKPDMSCFDEEFENYADKTIEVHYRKEKLHASWFHFMEVRIKHPSQFRMALANDQYGSSRKKPSVISREVNAVAAVNGCFYNRRTFGILIYKRKLLRNRPFGVDVLLIDSEGNFHIVLDKQIAASGVLEEYDIVSAVSFGPELVHDGETLRLNRPNWEPLTEEPRTAICQYDDPLHYLVVLAEGRNTRSDGVTMQTFAEVVGAQGVRTAYNLDGGQSGTMVIGHHVKNRVGWGPEKPQSDILYFATGQDADEKAEKTE